MNQNKPDKIVVWERDDRRGWADVESEIFRAMVLSPTAWLHAPNYVPYVSVESVDNHNKEVKDVLTKLLNAGAWYHSALEIDPYEQSYDGIQLEQMIKDLLDKIERKMK